MMFKKIKDIENKLNMSKKYPGYFTKSIFRFGLLIIVLLTFAVMVQEDFDFSRKIYMECPNQSQPCPNPYSTCLSNFSTIDKKSCDIMCEQGFCQGGYIMPGTYTGDKPGHLYKYFLTYITLIIGLVFFVNHLNSWRS